MSRGGAGRGQGRKPALSREQEMLVGDHCEYLWEKVAEDQALARYTNTPEGRMIAGEQERSQLIPVAARRRSTSALQDISDSINDIINPDDPDHAKRGSTILIDRRPYGAKGEILRKAAEWCEATFGVAISPNKADECWDRYRRAVAYGKSREV